MIRGFKRRTYQYTPEVITLNYFVQNAVVIVNLNTVDLVLDLLSNYGHCEVLLVVASSSPDTDRVSTRNCRYCVVIELIEHSVMIKKWFFSCSDLNSPCFDLPWYNPHNLGVSWYQQFRGGADLSPWHSNTYSPNHTDWECCSYLIQLNWVPPRWIAFLVATRVSDRFLSHDGHCYCCSSHYFVASWHWPFVVSSHCHRHRDSLDSLRQRQSFASSWPSFVSSWWPLDAWSSCARALEIR